MADNTLRSTGINAGGIFSPSSFQSPFVHQFQGPARHAMGNSRQSLLFSAYRSPAVMHRLNHAIHRTFGGGLLNPFSSLTSSHLPSVPHVAHPMFPHMSAGRWYLNSPPILNKRGLHGQKRFRSRNSSDGSPGKRNRISRYTPKAS